MAKLTAEMVVKLRASRLSSRKLADLYGLPKGTIEHAKGRRTWRHIL
jgi:hypothetical protein